MKICDDNWHGEIVHNDQTCPACERVEELVKRIEGLNDKVLELKDEIKEIEEETRGKE